MHVGEKPARAVVLRGGRVIDPATELDGTFDVLLEHGRIARIAPQIDATAAGADVLDVRGKIVTAGLIDFHAHIYHGLSAYGLLPDRVGVRSGVTHVNDVGSTGWLNFAGFKINVADHAISRVTCFPNIVGVGVPENYVAGAQGLIAPSVRADLLIAIGERHRELIRGVKVHVERGFMSQMQESWEAFDAAREVTEALGVNLYVHLGDLIPIREDGPTPDPDALPLEVIEKMRPGEVLGHCFTQHAGGLVSAEGRVSPAARAASQRGILHEVGHGVNMSFFRARRFLDAGLLPDIISSDAHGAMHGGRVHPVRGLEPDVTGDFLCWTMTGTMSKVLALGVGLVDVIRMSTINPARAIGIAPDEGTLTIGSRADLTVLELRDGKYWLVDSVGDELPADRVILPWATILDGRVTRLDPLSMKEFHDELIEPRASAAASSPAHARLAALRAERLGHA
jgi:dihydroorotase